MGTIIVIAISGTMEWLKLGFNRLDEVPSEPLRDMIQLRELDLRGNNISKLESYAFSPFGANLKFLYMMHNRIASLSPEAFANLPHLEWLYLNHNRLRVLHRSVFEKITDTLVILDVHGMETNALHRNYNFFYHFPFCLIPVIYYNGQRTGASATVQDTS